MLKRLFVKLCVVLMSLILICIFFAMNQSSHFRRDPVVLMNKYYQYKQTNPSIAEQALYLILRQNPNDLPAMAELSQWLLDTKHYHEALPLLERIHQRLPGNEMYTYQLGYVYYEEGQWEDAVTLFKKHSLAAQYYWHFKMEQAMTAMSSFLPTLQDYSRIAYLEKPIQSTSSIQSIQTPNSSVTPTKPTPRGVDWGVNKNEASQLYVSKKRNARTFHDLEQWIKQHPADETALKEAGFWAIKHHQTTLALHYLTRAYLLSHDPHLAMQIAYLYNALNQNKMAYRYFQWAAYTQDSLLASRAENALTKLKGEQTKLLPPPYFGEFFAMPFTQSRFGLTVTQFIGRLGIELPMRWKTRAYVFGQGTDDNQSKAAQRGQLSEIYEDDVQITGLGLQISPLVNVPVILYGEMGAAYDLVYQNRNRWRSNFRGGFMYYQEFGQAPAFYSQPTWSTQYYSNWYGDLTYFSRYNNNVIGLFRTHQGIRLFQYKSSMVNAYARGLVVQDVQRLFYNNYAEVGPGISFIPSNRYNLEVRFDYIKGMYLPAGGIYNPYNKYYTNKLLQLFLYIKI